MWSVYNMPIHNELYPNIKFSFTYFIDGSTKFISETFDIRVIPPSDLHRNIFTSAPLVDWKVKSASIF
jgi:hypothetical protein